MSGPPPGPGPVRAMSVGNGPPSAGLPPQHAMPPQQNVPPPASSSGPQSQQNLNQIVSRPLFSLRSLYLPAHTSGAFETVSERKSIVLYIRGIVALGRWIPLPAMISLAMHSMRLHLFGELRLCFCARSPTWPTQCAASRSKLPYIAQPLNSINANGRLVQIIYPHDSSPWSM